MDLLFDIQLFSEGEGDSSSMGEDASSSEAEFSKLIKGRYKDAYTKRTQSIISHRFKDTKELEEFRDRVTPLTDKLFEKHGVEKGDFEALCGVLFPEGEGRTEGAVETAGEGANEITSEVRYSLTDRGRRFAAEGIYRSWLKDAEGLRELYPSFDLARECSNPAFSAMLSAGVSMRDAFEAAHHRELLKGAMRYTAQKVSTSLWSGMLSGGSRPSENGLSSKGTPHQKRSVAGLSDRDIRSILKRVEKGERIRF